MPRKYQMHMVLAGATLGSAITGYSSAIISSTLGQPGWYQSMGLSQDPTSSHYSKTTSIISAANGIFYAGGFFGTVTSGFPAEKWGRVKSFRLAAILHLIGGALQAGSVNQPMYLIARLIAGFAVGQSTGTMTTYYSEISLPKRRGLLGGLHGLMIEVGACISAWIGLGTFYSSNSSFAWRFPISLICLLAIALFAVTWFLPETPRWLLRNERSEEALLILAQLHKSSEIPNMATKEFEHIQLQSIADREAVSTYGKWQLFTHPSYRKRLVIAFSLVCFIQSCGILLIYNYSNLIYTTLGLNNAQSLAISGGWITWTAVCIIFGNLVADRLSRRQMLIAGLGGSCLFVILYTASLAQYLLANSTKWAALAVVFIFLLVVPFGSSLTNNQFTVVNELFPNHLRSQASAISISALYLIQVLWLNVGPLALERVSWRFYIVFIVLAACGAIFVYFFVPNTSGIPLEEIDALFGIAVAGDLSAMDGKSTTNNYDIEVARIESVSKNLQ